MIRLLCNRLTALTVRCESDSCCTKESSDQYSRHIAGSLILLSVFLFAKDVRWEALATKPYTDTDVLLASNWRTQKQWERWPVALFISLAQTLKCNRFWRYTSVISAEVYTSWTELQGKGSPPTYTLDKFRANWTIELQHSTRWSVDGLMNPSFFSFSPLRRVHQFPNRNIGKTYFKVDPVFIFHFLSSSLLPTVRGENE